MSTAISAKTISKDLKSGIVVFLVALPLCLGIALASGAPLFSGIIAGIVGGIVVGAISGSHTSVSGPAAGLTAVVAGQLAALGGSFEAFLCAVFLAGIFQIILGALSAGSIAEFFPSSVIKGLLAAIGIILILKQIPHLFGYDSSLEGSLAFQQANNENTFTQLLGMAGNVHGGASAIGVLCLVLLLVYKKIPIPGRDSIPAPLVIVLLGTGIKIAFDSVVNKSLWTIDSEHLVQLPAAESFAGFLDFLQMADFSQLSNPVVYTAALTIGVVASLETLLNLEAVDELDKKQRTSPPNRELVAQGCGNMCAGLLGGIPVTSVIIRSSVNVDTGSETKCSALFHGILLLLSVALFPTLLNNIPLSCLAAILIVTGIKLANPRLFRQMWLGGKTEFVPFIVTVVAIVFTDLLSGILLGLAVSIAFILQNNLKQPIRKILEKHVGEDVLRVELPNQVSFLNRASVKRALRQVEDGGHILIDARGTSYIDPDVMDVIHEFEDKTAPAHRITVSMLGFEDHYDLLDDKVQFVDYSCRDTQQQMTPGEALQVLLDGNERFKNGEMLTRNLGRQVAATADAQHPIACVLSCIDSRTSAEVVFDMGIGDIFNVRVAGNVTSPKVLGSIEYACAKAGSKLVFVMGHSRCGAVTSAMQLIEAGKTALEATGCHHIDSIVEEITCATDKAVMERYSQASDIKKIEIVDDVARCNVLHSVAVIREQSQTLREMEERGEIAMVGAIYDVASASIQIVT